MIKIKNNYFILGLIIFYIILFFSPNKIVYFSAYFISTLFFYLYSRNIKISVVLSIILSLFSNVNLAGSLFLIQPEILNYGSGYWISPHTILILYLLPVSLNIRSVRFKLTDLFLLLFFLWNIFIFILFPYQNVLFGLISLGETIIIYYLLRIYISKHSLPLISKLIISMIIFQSFVGILQFLLKRPIGLLAETSEFIAPFGLVTVENENLFRLMGTFTHPNNFSAILLSVLPFLLLLNIKNRRISLFRIVPLVVLFFTYTRSAWLIILAILLLISLMKGYYKISLNLSKSIIPSVIIILTFIILVPYFFIRLISIPEALAVRGSVDVRFKQYEEASNIISQYPITGVGLYRSVETYASNPVTDILDSTARSKYYRIHNIFLEIAAETGILGLTIFIFFLGSVFWNYLKREKNYYRNAAFLGLIGLTGISMLNPFFHTPQFLLFFLLSAIILA